MAPRTASPTALQTGLQFLIKDLLRFWMGNIHREGRGETRSRHPTGAGGNWGWVRSGEKAQAPDWCRKKLRLAPQRGEGAPHPGSGESAPVKLLAA